MCHTWKASHVPSKSIKHTDRRIWVQPTVGPQCKPSMCATWMRPLSVIRVDPHPLYNLSSTPKVSASLILQQFFMCVLAVFLLLKHRSCRLFMFGNNHQNTVDLQPYLHPALSCGIAVEARYEQNPQTRGIMPCNVCLVIIWLLQTGRGDVNVINLARLTQRARSGI